MAKLHYSERYDMIETYCKIIKNGQLNALTVVGTPGSGKSYMVKKVLGDDASYYQGGVKGSEDLIRILYNNREGEILVLDDFDSCMRTVEMKNILKTALQDVRERIISYPNYKVNYQLPKKFRIPEKFTFTSGIIFISNRDKIDPALKSRSMEIVLRPTKLEMLKRIEDCLEGFMPRLPMAVKEEVYKFIFNNRAKIKKIDFRKFKFAVATRCAEPEKWKNWVLHNLTN